MTAPLRIGFAGIKAWSDTLRGFATAGPGGPQVADGVELVAAADADPAQLALAREKFGIRETYADYRDMLEKSRLDAEPPWFKQTREFIRAIRSDTTPLNSAEDALALMRMLSALRRSGEERRSIALGEGR